jgi:DNA-binding PadR family transcriptional regulator
VTAPKGRPLVVLWREAVRDSRELDPTAKLVAYTLSLHRSMNANGYARPSRLELATQAALHESCRALDSAIRRLERAGFLDVRRTRGHARNLYVATLPTAHEERRNGARVTPSTASVERLDSVPRDTQVLSTSSKEEEEHSPQDSDRDIVDVIYELRERRS